MPSVSANSNSQKDTNGNSKEGSGESRAKEDGEVNYTPKDGEAGTRVQHANGGEGLDRPSHEPPEEHAEQNRPLRSREQRTQELQAMGRAPHLEQFTRVRPS
jgi:hypothetical protein